MRALIISIIILSFACSNSKRASDSANDIDDSKAKVELDTLFMTFERTLCFGECPAYRITVNRDGSCLYEGFKFVDKIGIYEANIPLEKINEINEEAIRIDFFDLKEKYDASVSDVPSCIMTISRGSGRKTVIDRHEAPDFLRAFEKYVDRVLLNLDWKESDRKPISQD